MTTLSETTRIITESRKLLEDGQDTNISNSILLQIFLDLVSSMDSSIQQIKTGMHKIDEINNSVTALAYDIRTLTTDLRTVETKQKTMETSVQVMSDMFDDIKQKCDRFTMGCIDLNSRLGKIERDFQGEKKRLAPTANTMDCDEINRLNETVLDLQCRSMKNNLIFAGLTHSPGENCEQKLRNFIYEQLGLEEHIEFGNVHRFGRVGRNGARPIVARFIYYHQRSMVLDNSFRLRRSPFVIHEQFPAKIVERRHALYPVMNEARRQGKRTSMIRDKLYINGESYKPPIQNSTKNPDSRNYREALLTPQRGGRVSNTPDRPFKRHMVGSSPIPEQDGTG